MSGFAKGIAIAMLVPVVLVIMMNLAFFFPWYITVIETAFEVSQIVANENYLPNDDYNNILDQLKNKPIFDKRPGAIDIKVTHSGGDGIERGSARGAEYYYDRRESEKPYVQRGNPITVEVSARYPFQMQLNGSELPLPDIPVSISLRTTALKYYKDLYYYVAW